MDARGLRLPEPGPVVIATVLEPGAEATLAAVRAAPEGCALVELRADSLTGEEVAWVVRGAGRRVLVTVRRGEDGGSFSGTEEERRGILELALAAGAVGIDVEHGTPLADWAASLDPSRVVLSRHGGTCEPGALRRAVAAMSFHPARFRKLAPTATSPSDGAALRAILASEAAAGRRMAAFALGGAGLLSRVLAPAWGAWATYGSAGNLPVAPGQPSARDLLETWRVLAIGSKTRLYGLAGRPVLESPSPAMHAAGYRAAGIDAIYVPLEADSLDGVLALRDAAEPFVFGGAGITIPFKGDAARVADHADPIVAASAAANTLRFDPDGIFAANTDGPAILALLLDRCELAGARVAVVGAGGAARAAAAVLRDAGARVTIFNRTVERARAASLALGVGCASLDALRSASWDGLVQATPLGREGEEVLPASALCGHWVLDMAYGARPTPLVAAARVRGLEVADGLELLAAQAGLQFAVLTGRSVPLEVLAEARDRWLAGRLDEGRTAP